VQRLTYHYRFSLGETKDSWLIRWEYYRKRPAPTYKYPLGHVHIHASFLPHAAATLKKLHIPTARVALEWVLWHLIAEWGVQSKDPDWRKILEDSIHDFERKRTVVP
jgi:hypothetical protein